tara:strand:+ start:3061 stop:3726 length:666 start_codon:yes stop_codon:yes gene_type:complete
MIIYVCSYGGSGSMYLCRKLREMGLNCRHIHSRNPPEKLQHVGPKFYRDDQGNKIKDKSHYDEWFRNDTEISEKNLDNFRVIYIYRNPVDAIISRFHIKAHLYHIQCPDTNITIDNVIESRKDLYGIKEFYNNYVQKNIKRNYSIYCVKFEDLFKEGNIDVLLKSLKLSTEKRNGLKNVEISVRESRSNLDRISNYKKEILSEIYHDVIDDMNKNPFIFEV